MSFTLTIRTALRALFLHPLRSGLSMLSILIGVAAIITMVAIGTGAQQLIRSEIRSLGSNILLITPGSATEGAVRLGAGTRSSLIRSDVSAIRDEVRGVVAAAAAVVIEAQIINGNRNRPTLVGGIGQEYLITRDWPIARGRPFSADDFAHTAKVTLLGQTSVARLFGDDEPLDAIVRINGTPFTVVGVLAKKGRNAAGRDQDDVALVPLATAKSRLHSGGRRDAVDFIMVKVDSPAVIQPAAESIRALLRQLHRIRRAAADDFTVVDPVAAMEAEASILDSLRLVLGAIAALSLVVGGITIANVLLVAVKERTREIGIRLAVGARPAVIRQQFLVEATVLATLGGIAGVSLGLGLSALLSSALDWPLTVEGDVVALALIIAAATGVGAGWYPSLRAAETDPIAALRVE